MKTSFKSAVRLLVFVLSLNIFQPSHAQSSNPIYEDQPMPGEEFKYFFKRITRGGVFPGIILDAPESVKAAALKRLKRTSWQGPVNQERKRLTGLGINLWQDWYVEQAPLRILAPTEQILTDLNQSHQTFTKADARCYTQKCRSLLELYKIKWQDWAAPERQAFTLATLFSGALLKGTSVFAEVAAKFGFQAEDILKQVQVQILNAQDFEVAVRKMGWGGPIYFRGITGVDPQDPNRYWVLLHDDFLREKTAFDYAIYQALEYAVILSHELSHVAQDMEAKKLGIDLRVFSAEGGLLIEGMAESLSESALVSAGQKISVPHPLSLFVHEQAVEVVNRPGNDTTGALFPYTIGLPFVTALYDLKAGNTDKRGLNEKIYAAIVQKPILQEMLFKEFP